jgi:hypothetical protein
MEALCEFFFASEYTHFSSDYHSAIRILHIETQI